MLTLSYSFFHRSINNDVNRTLLFAFYPIDRSVENDTEEEE